MSLDVSNDFNIEVGSLKSHHLEEFPSCDSNHQRKTFVAGLNETEKLFVIVIGK